MVSRLRSNLLFSRKGIVSLRKAFARNDVLLYLYFFA